MHTLLKHVVASPLGQLNWYVVLIMQWSTLWWKNNWKFCYLFFVKFPDSADAPTYHLWGDDWGWWIRDAAGTVLHLMPSRTSYSTWRNKCFPASAPHHCKMIPFCNSGTTNTVSKQLAESVRFDAEWLFCTCCCGQTWQTWLRPSPCLPFSF